MYEETLKENIKTFLRSANIIFNSEDFTSATILYFKTLFSVLDLVILKLTGKIPKDHSDRFRMLEEERKDLYLILDKIYSTYRNTYTSRVNKEDCLKIKENVERIIKKERIFENS